MIRAQGWGDWPGVERDVVVLTQEQLRVMRVVSHATDLVAGSGGEVALWWDRYGAPARSVLFEVTAIGGAWRWSGHPGGRVACAEDDPRRAPESSSPGRRNALGYRQVHTECPALDALLGRAAR